MRNTASDPDDNIALHLLRPLADAAGEWIRNNGLNRAYRRPSWSKWSHLAYRAGVSHHTIRRLCTGGEIGLDSAAKIAAVVGLALRWVPAAIAEVDDA